VAPVFSSTRTRLFVVTVAAAMVVVIAAVAIGRAAGGASSAPPAQPSGAAVTNALFRGIPQAGVTLGNPSAPVTLTEFADLQCPFCRQYSDTVLPTVVQRYVRTGQVKLVFRTLAFIGPDSERAAQMAAAAALQNRLWQFDDLVYRNQGQENSGYVTDAYLRSIANAAGVNADEAFAQRTSAAVRDELAAANSQAGRLGVNSTPSFLVAAKGQPARLLPSGVSSVQELARAIGAARAGQ
jgi:protein-disulfide isomerase